MTMARIVERVYKLVDSQCEMGVFKLDYVIRKLVCCCMV